MEGEIDRIAAEAVPGCGRRFAGMRSGDQQRCGALVIWSNVAAVRNPDALDGKPVDGQGPGLVGGDQRTGAEALDSRQLAHDNVAQTHAVHRGRQRHGHRGRQTFGYSRDGQRDAEQKDIGRRGAPERFQQGEDRDQPHHRHREVTREPCHALNQRRRRLRPFQRRGDDANRRLAGGGHRDGDGATGPHGCPGI